MRDTHTSAFLQCVLRHPHSKHLLQALVLDSYENFRYSLYSFFLSEQLFGFIIDVYYNPHHFSENRIQKLELYGIKQEKIIKLLFQ